ncbi:hypothetical protein KDAU_59480 [Dictyobacter aurantiacus]|uniref:Uncharacterized protein n=1 Tax=Dictyobacter aurantiacus TaxID=1936993 RepID=A0A401ZP16_9CHLR|nr:hypothetical protein KDAU_59480 [Dictyobacter aurantiacus]
MPYLAANTNSKSVSDSHDDGLRPAWGFAPAALRIPLCVRAWGALMRTPCTNTQKQCGRVADAPNMTEVRHALERA